MAELLARRARLDELPALVADGWEVDHAETFNGDRWSYLAVKYLGDDRASDELGEVGDHGD